MTIRIREAVIQMTWTLKRRGRKINIIRKDRIIDILKKEIGAVRNVIFIILLQEKSATNVMNLKEYPKGKKMRKLIECM